MTGDRPPRPQPRGHAHDDRTPDRGASERGIPDAGVPAPGVPDPGASDRGTTLGQAITRYLETARLSPDARAAQRSTLLRFGFHAGLDVPVSQVPRDAVDDFLWTSQGHGGATLAADVIALRSFRRWCGSHHLPARGIAAGLRGRP